ncbi:MAG: hypothetical protein PUC66_02605 [Erysipelotrichaceae bacterium]|nr:hypothetical protein [Erysipelotrichaceae bacterium]
MTIEEIQIQLDGARSFRHYDNENWERFFLQQKKEFTYPYVAVTGSNGKEDVAYYLSSIEKEAGYVVGYFGVSRVLPSKNDIQINGKAIPDGDFVRIYSRYEQDFRRFSLSDFEILLWISLVFFEEQNVSLAILVAGMGGQNDATNLPRHNPLLVIITSVSLEHTAVLGTTLSEIATEKAGLLKERGQCLIGHLPDAASEAVRLEAQKKRASVFTVDSCHYFTYQDPYFRFDYVPYSKLEILSPARYLLDDAALAIEATKILRLRFPVSEEALRKGLLIKPLPCRMERHRQVIFDGAHNPEAIDLLLKSVMPLTNGKPLHVLFASMRDKNIASELSRIGTDAKDITLTTFSHPYAKGEMDYFLYVADYPYVEDAKMALQNLIHLYPDDWILVTGSFVFANALRLQEKI